MFADIVLFADANALASQPRQLSAGAYIIAQRFASPAQVGELRAALQRSNLKFRLCHILEKPDTNELQRFRQCADFTAVRGASTELCKFAASSKASFLLQPFSEGKAVFDAAIARLCADSGTIVVFQLAPLISAGPVQRSALFRGACLVARLCRKRKVDCMFASFAANPSGLRNPAAMVSFATLLGFTSEQARRFVERFPETLFTKGD